jgi:S-adenosylmethionine:tRNA ribosyltransferase-isomerase
VKTSDFDYELPDELIAQHPPATRPASRLLRLNGESGALNDSRFSDLPDFVRSGDVFVFNDTKVVKARMHGRKETGGAVEVLVERVLRGEDGRSQRALAHVRASKSPLPCSRLDFPQGVIATVHGRRNDLFELEFPGERTVYEILAAIGEVPLPPYISHTPEVEDEARYQTVYAKHPGSVAAPTAGLHFDEDLLERLTALGAELAYVTLHVGAGTFQPVRDDDISQHVMHSEWYDIPAATADIINRSKAEGRRITAVGTTSMRTLEAASVSGVIQACAAETSLFVTPGYQFRIVDRLLTNFHLPKSTLMMLVSAFAGYQNTMRAYRHAVAARYRFFSYGDAMLIDRRVNSEPD